MKYKFAFLTLALMIVLLLAGCHDSNSTGAPAVTSHGVNAGYAGACLVCHGEGSGAYQFPVSGPNDHRGRSNDTCLTCHK